MYIKQEEKINHFHLRGFKLLSHHYVKLIEARVLFAVKGASGSLFKTVKNCTKSDEINVMPPSNQN